MTHTPGPWRVRPDGVTIQGNGTLYVADCRVSSDYRSDKETRANAKLIAAAPRMKDLLATMTGMAEIDGLGSQSNEWRTALLIADALLKEIDG